MDEGAFHVPVLLDELVQGLRLRPDSRVIDATVGGAGHSLAIARALGPSGRLLCIDQDREALDQAGQRLRDCAPAVTLVHSNFGSIGDVARANGLPQCDAIVADLGVSSHQLDSVERGFSFMHDAPLDMRMDRDGGTPVFELLQRLGEAELSKIIRDYGEEAGARRIARAIKQDNPQTTGELARLVESVLGGRRGRRIHPATKTFQALRMAANDELDALRRLLQDAPDLLAVRGRLAIISFHSLEDRMVKRAFAERARTCTCPPEAPLCTCGADPEFELVSRKALRPADAEAAANPRARSAKLRILSKRVRKSSSLGAHGVTDL
ncbi:MAG: 16S rRNA (cytosine(1402)-N(4))-methyltransferase RsmH [Pseudomonadota bacterium]